MHKIKCFGIAKDIVNDSNIDCSVELKSVLELREWLNSTFVEFNSLSRYMIAVNEEYALDDQLLKSDDVIAIIPPVSGG